MKSSDVRCTLNKWAMDVAKNLKYEKSSYIAYPDETEMPYENPWEANCGSKAESLEWVPSRRVPHTRI